MDILAMIKAQGDLDKFIRERNGMDDYKLTETCLALMVEVGECANEDASFKYWKQNKRVNRADLLEEFADIMAFVFSLAFYARLHKQVFLSKVYEVSYEANVKNSISGQFIELMASIVAFSSAAEGLAKNNPTKDGMSGKESLKLISKAENMIFDMLHVAKLLGISQEELETAYYKKNKKNYDRQYNGY